MINSYLNHLQESSIPTKWRQRVEVYILHGDKIMVGFQKNNNLYLPAGGGVEKGQTLYTAAENEALEELGVQIKNPVLIDKKPFLSDWYKLQAQGVELNSQIKERMKELRGQKIYFVKAEYVKVDKKYYGRDNDAMKPVLMTKQRLIKEFKKNNWRVSKHRIKIVGML